MMKFKGKDYPVSLMKVTLHDTTFDKLDWIRDNLKVKNNAEALTLVINSVYGQLKEMVEYHENGGNQDDRPSL